MAAAGNAKWSTCLKMMMKCAHFLGIFKQQAANDRNALCIANGAAMALAADLHCFSQSLCLETATETEAEAESDHRQH